MGQVDKGGRVKMKYIAKIIEAVGVVVFLIGCAAMDGSLMAAATMVIAGLGVMAAGVSIDGEFA